MNTKEVITLRRSAWLKSEVLVPGGMVRALCDEVLDHREAKAGFKPMGIHSAIIFFLAGLALGLTLAVNVTGSVHSGEYPLPGDPRNVVTPSLYGSGPAQIYSTPLESFAHQQKPPC